MIKVSLFSELFVDPNFLLKTIILHNSTGTNMDMDLKESVSRYLKGQ